jgi:pimeloyl-ACP methyl ester carboxylesterase
MAYANIRDVALRYEVLGESGPGAALIPGGRNGIDQIRSFAQRLARAGYRVLIHDRRNCGASDVAFDASASEDQIAADDLHALLAQLGMLPAIIGGSSSGARVALSFALRYSRDLPALLLWRVTGGAFAVRRLVEKYWDEFARAAEQGGMQAVMRTEHFAEVIRNRPSNRARLLAIDPKYFIVVMRRWRDLFQAGADMPLVGVSERDLRSITAPVCLIPGDDLTHRRQAAIDAAQFIADCEVHSVAGDDQNLDVSPPQEWQAREAQIVQIFTDFLARKLTPRVPGAPMRERLNRVF